MRWALRRTYGTANDHFRKICLSLPEAYEKVAWSAPTFRVGDRQFAMFADNHHGDGVVGPWCKAADGVQEDLVASNAKVFFRPPYAGPPGWLGIRPDRGLDWAVVAGLVRDGYLEVAPRRLRLVLQDPASSGPAPPRHGRRKKSTASESRGLE